MRHLLSGESVVFGTSWMVNGPVNHKMEDDAMTENVLADLREGWRTNNRINLLILTAISPDGLHASLSTRGGRDVAGQFAHIHNNRVWHLQRRSKDLASDLEIFPPKTSPRKPHLKKALTASCRAVEALLTGIMLKEPNRRGFKKGLFTTFGYFVAHESHHRGSILLTLKQSGFGLDKGTQYAVWGWDQI